MHRILLVDDSEITRQSVTRALKTAGYSVHAVDSPIGLTRLVEEHQPDLVLVDVGLPSMPGDKAVEILIKHRRHLCPLVLYSGLSTEELEALVPASGADGYIRKGDSHEGLVQAIEFYLAQRPSERTVP